MSYTYEIHWKRDNGGRLMPTEGTDLVEGTSISDALRRWTERTKEDIEPGLIRRATVGRILSMGETLKTDLKKIADEIDELEKKSEDEQYTEVEVAWSILNSVRSIIRGM